MKKRNQTKPARKPPRIYIFLLVLSDSFDILVHSGFLSSWELSVTYIWSVFEKIFFFFLLILMFLRHVDSSFQKIGNLYLVLGMDCPREDRHSGERSPYVLSGIVLVREWNLGHFIMVNFFLPSSFSFLVIASARGGVIQFNSIFKQTTLLKMVKTSLEGNCFMYF